jgi:BirA family biotin operon repressor/biotin-[acetyl-CoA-carboxylase] ligase
VTGFRVDRVTPRLEPGPLAWAIHYEATCGSTQDLAREAASAGAAEGWTVVTDLQRSGRGRQGRSWIAAAKESVLFSTVWRPAPALLSLLPLLAAVAVSDGIRAATGLLADIKWPNDLLLDGRKLAGILLERPPGAVVILGVGINVNTAETDLLPEATSLRVALKRAVDREALFAAVLNALADARGRFAREGPAWIVPTWRSRSSMLGQQITYRQGRRSERATAEDIEADGRLRVRRDDGRVVSLVAGEIERVRAQS